MEDYSGVSFLTCTCTRKLMYLHHSFLRNLDAFGLLCYIELLVFANQILLPFPGSDEILPQVAFAVWAWENLPPVFYPIWHGMIFEKDIPVSAPWFALSTSLIDWSLYTSKTTSIPWLDVWLVSTLLCWAAFLIPHQCHTITFHFLRSCHGIYDCSTQCMSDSLLRCHTLLHMPSQFRLVFLRDPSFLANAQGIGARGYLTFLMSSCRLQPMSNILPNTLLSAFSMISLPAAVFLICIALNVFNFCFGIVS